MSHFKNKSELNRAAADLLQRSNYYPSVIHCAYYSCVQLMKHILIVTLGIAEIELNNETRNSTKGSHEIIINRIIIYLKNNSKDWRTFNSKINQLKKLRVDADYTDISIDSSKGSNSIQLSDEVSRLLR